MAIWSVWLSLAYGTYQCSLVILTLHFGLRVRQEYHNMKVEDFTFKKHDWFTYATFSEGITQARQ